MKRVQGVFLLPVCALFICAGMAYAHEGAPSGQALKADYQIVYHNSPGTAESIEEMFSKGDFYGRLRSNSFYFRWNTEDEKHSINLITGVGGSIIYRSARYDGFDIGLGLYGSQAYFNDNEDPIAHIKPGKDLLSRFMFVNYGSKSMGVLGQGWLRYSDFSKSRITVGRQLVETFYTKSNDSKMIPNTFDGVVIDSRTIPDTIIRVAYLTEQKLKDHTFGSSPLMYGDANSSSMKMPQWSENDDSVMHRGLTYTALKAAAVSTDAPLITGDLHNRSIPDLKADISFYTVKDLLSEVMGELNYKIDLPGDYSIIPGVRYIRQFDNGAGRIGGASYLGRDYTEGYSDPDSLDSQMIAMRLLGKYKSYRVNLAYSYVSDEADLITPWRGFPTSGYTRSMGTYNWRAGTKSYRLEVKKNANPEGIYRDLFVQASILYVDGDEEKKGPHIDDHIYYYLGFIKNLESMPSLQWRLRLGYSQFLDDKANDFNYIDSRFEINYLF